MHGLELQSAFLLYSQASQSAELFWSVIERQYKANASAEYASTFSIKFDPSGFICMLMLTNREVFFTSICAFVWLCDCFCGVSQYGLFLVYSVRFGCSEEQNA